jgi:hypothetical protein
MPVGHDFDHALLVGQNKLTHYRPYSKSSLTLTEWKFNLSFSSAIAVFE